MTSPVAVCLAVGVLHAGMVSAGCSLAGSPSALVDTLRPADAELYIANVPFHPQQTYHCGPASLAAVLNYWGDQSSPDDIADAIYSPRLKGTLGVDMWTYAQAHHFKAEMRSGSLDQLEQLILRKIPVIAFLNLGYDWFPVPHFVVVVGLDPHTSSVITYNGREQNSVIPYDQFTRAWGKTNFWTLVVAPADGGDPHEGRRTDAVTARTL
jgi:ABC-type bacteriocin/lantibiotic exporter with double-glycine peptidase domain